MSAFKKLQLGDSLTVGYTAKKNWIIEDEGVEGFGVDYYEGITSSLHVYPNDSDYSKKLKYRSIQQLYYGDVADPTIYSTGSYINYEQTTLSNLVKEKLNDSIVCLSFNKNIVSNNIEPGTFSLDLVRRVENERSINPINSLDPEGTRVIVDSIPTTKLFKDDGEGTLVNVFGGNNPVGKIFYTHGTVVVTNANAVRLIKNFFPTIDYIYQTNYDVFTTTYNIRIQDSEFNFTQNPSARSGSLLNSNVTGSEFSPYITTVGLYNDASELIAVAKLSRPIPKSKSTDMTIVINLDM